MIETPTHSWTTDGPQQALAVSTALSSLFNQNKDALHKQRGPAHVVVLMSSSYHKYDLVLMVQHRQGRFW